MTKNLSITEQEQFRKDNETIHQSFIANPMGWGFIFFKHHFRDNSPWFHAKILTEALKHRFFAVQAPRESAKSTILTFLYAIWSICFKKKRFIVIVQNTYKKSATSLDTIKKEFKENAMLKQYFGVEIIRDAEGDAIFRHPDGFETRVLCKGTEQIGSIRGEKFGAYRPDLFIIDDLEDDEMVRNPERPFFAF